MDHNPYLKDGAPPNADTGRGRIEDPAAIANVPWQTRPAPPTKFELALLMTKLIDVCTVEDVQYNFTEHFYRHPKESDELMQAGLASEAEVFAILSLSRSFAALHSNPAPLTRYCRPNKQDTTNADSGGGTLPRCGPLATAP